MAGCKSNMADCASKKQYWKDAQRTHRSGFAELCVAIFSFVGALVAGSAFAGEARLKNGVMLSGRLAPVPSLNFAASPYSSLDLPTVYPILMIDTGMIRYFVADTLVARDGISRDADLSRFDEFTLPQRKSGKRLVIESLGAVKVISPFDKYGRRTISLATDRNPLRIVQGITRITPQHLTVSGINCNWEYAIATTSVPPETLDAMIRTAIDPANPQDRMAVARFYLEAELYPQAGRELDAIAEEFPDYAGVAETVALDLRQLYARQLLNELHLRQAAGQHRLAYQAAQVFPTAKMSAAVLREVSEISTRYDESRETIEHSLVLLGELQAQLNDEELKSEVMPLRSTLKEQLGLNSVHRLDAFLKLENDNSLTPADKLALAYSGWMLGSARSVTDLNATLRLWQARFLVREYLRTANPNDRDTILGRLHSIEGVSPQVVRQMIPLLPPFLESPEILPGYPHRIVVRGEDAEVPVAYSVLLPPEYSPHRSYPLIVALKSAGQSAASILNWWGGSAEHPGQAQRRGYVVIAPEYVEDDEHKYNYSATSHVIVIESIRDACKRFVVDSDRIYLGGHGIGGDAAFDLGMSHPDEFAGVMCINGLIDKYCIRYWENVKHLPWYVVGGELDRVRQKQNAGDLDRMMKHNFNVIYAEYIGRGFESYFAEIHKLFDWMALQRRTKFLKDLQVQIMRPTDNRFFWMELHGFPRNVVEPVVWKPSGGTSSKPMKLRFSVRDGSKSRTSIHIRSGAARHTLWLSPDFIDFDKRLRIEIGARQKFNDFLQPDLKTLLEDLRRRGDRQKLFTVKLEFE